LQDAGRINFERVVARERRRENRDEHDEQNVLPLTRAGTQFLLYAFEWTSRWWERIFGLYQYMLLLPGEVERRFAQHFDIEKIASHVDYTKLPAGEAVYLITRK
jgi:hypothetical protein